MSIPNQFPQSSPLALPQEMSPGYCRAQLAGLVERLSGEKQILGTEEVTRTTSQLAKAYFFITEANQTLSPREKKESLDRVIKAISQLLAARRKELCCNGERESKKTAGLLDFFQRLMQQTFASAIEDAKKEMRELREIISARLQLAEQEHRQASEIPREEAEAFILKQKEKAAKCVADSLIQEEEELQRRASTCRSTKTHQNQRRPQAVKKSASKQSKPSQVPSTSKQKATNKNEILSAKLLPSPPSQKNTFKQHPRVTKRWKTADSKAIRTFRDFNNQGELVHRYQDMSEDALMWQRARHYLPGLEQLVLEPKERALYSFPTKNGYGLFVDLYFNGQCHHGVVYLGIGTDKVLYHRYFEVIKDLKEMESVFQGRGVEEPSTKEDDEPGEWTNVGDYVYDRVSGDGILTLRFTKETHFLQIHPVRPDLLESPPKV